MGEVEARIHEIEVEKVIWRGGEAEGGEGKPVVVRPTEGGYELIEGAGRLRSAKERGERSVECVFVRADERESREAAIVAGLKRGGLDMFEAAAGYAALLNLFDLTQEGIARRLDVSQSYIANRLRLLRYTSAEREFILSHHLTERHARAVLRLDNPRDRLAALEHIAAHSLNVSATESYIDALLGEAPVPTADPASLFRSTLARTLSLLRASGLTILEESLESDEGITVRLMFVRN